MLALHVRSPAAFRLLWTMTLLACVVGWGVSTKVEVERKERELRQQKYEAARLAIGQVWKEIEVLRNARRGDEIPGQVKDVRTEEELHFYFRKIQYAPHREQEWKRIRAKLGALLQDGGAGRRAESRLRLNGADAITKAHAMLTQQLDKARASKNLAMVKVFESMINMSIQKTRESCEQTRMQIRGTARQGDHRNAANKMRNLIDEPRFVLLPAEYKKGLHVELAALLKQAGDEYAVRCKTQLEMVLREYAEDAPLVLKATQMLRDVSESQVHALWGAHDKDESGSLDALEVRAMKAAAEAQHGIHAAAFEQADADSDSKLTMDEALTGMMDHYQRTCGRGAKA